MSKTVVLFLIFGLCFSLPVYAGIGGKITGKVVDAENGQPLPGVNIIVKGTSLGAATNLDGEYVILNVPPGTYNLEITMIGYAKYSIQNVRVMVDLTTNINAQLRAEVISGEEIVIIDERPVVTKDISNSQVNIEAKTIENIPIQTVVQALTLQAGIENDRQGIKVRGGGANQTIFKIDGLSFNDERSNIPYAAVSLSSVQEIKIQTGGFNAEYGNVRSGLVNVVTKEGAKDKYSFTAMVRYGPPSAKHFGPSVYDEFSYYNRAYMDPAVCWTGTRNGEPYEDLNLNEEWDDGEPFTDFNGDGQRSFWDIHTQAQYPYFQGWNAYSQTTLQDGDSGNDLTPEAAKRLFEWQHRRQGDIKKPDYVIDFGLGGPFPFISKELGNLRFHATYFNEKNMFVFPLSRDSYKNNHAKIKITSDLNSSIKLILTGLYGEIRSVSPYNWKTTPTGRVISTQEEVAGLLNSSSGNSILYMPGYYSPSSVYRKMYAAQITHVLNPQTFYEVKIQYSANRYNTFQMAVRDTSKDNEVFAGYFVDDAPYGYWGFGDPGIDEMSMGGWMNLGRDKSRNYTTSISFDLTSQVNFRNQVKTGLEIVYNNLDINSSTYSPSMTTWTRSMVYNISPYRLGAYIQDKLEFLGFIANAGLRLDYSEPNTERYVLDDYDDLYKSGNGDLIEQEALTEKVDASLTLNPRLGISHPISDNSKLYFNYGHFRSEPTSSNRFRLQRESNGLVTYIGDPNLVPEKTVAYELGFEQNLSNQLLLKIAAYYKDVSNQTNWVQYNGLRGISYYKAENNDYEDIRGFELTLTRRFGTWITGFINYTYDVRTSGYFGLTEYYENPTEQRNQERKNEYQEKPVPRPFARANLDFHIPNGLGPDWGGFYPLENWYLNVLAEWKTGRYETFNPNDIPGIENDVQWRDYHNFDLRISRVFNVQKFDIQLYLDITNIFNAKHMTAGLRDTRNYAGFADKYDYNNYLESLNFSWEDGVEHGNDKLGDYRPPGIAYDPLDPNPDNNSEIKAENDRRKKNKSYIDMPNIQSMVFLNPRRYTFGIKINF